jgi:hypothetical protein
MRRIQKTERIEWVNLCEEAGRPELIHRCMGYQRSEGEDSLTKEEILELLIQRFPKKDKDKK